MESEDGHLKEMPHKLRIECNRGLFIQGQTHRLQSIYMNREQEPNQDDGREARYVLYISMQSIRSHAQT